MTLTRDSYTLHAGSQPQTMSAPHMQPRTIPGVAMSLAGSIYSGPSVEDFREAVAFTALSEDSFADDWDNPEDAVYNTL